MARFSSTCMLFLAVALLGAASAASAQTCVVPLEVTPESKLALGGTVLRPIRMRMTPTSESKASGLVSVVFNGPCPTANTLAPALAGASIKRTSGSKFQLDVLTARILNMVFVDVSNFEAHLMSTGAIAEDGTVPVTLNVTAGAVTVRARRRTVVTPLAGRRIDGAGCSLSANPDEPGRIDLNCPTVMFSQMIEDPAEGVLIKAEAAGVLNAVGHISGARMSAVGPEVEEEFPDVEPLPADAHTIVDMSAEDVTP